MPFHSFRLVLLLSLLSLLGMAGASNAQNAPMMVDAGNDFGLTLLSILETASGPEANVFISPVSISQALGLLYIGSAGKTQSEIGSVLQVSRATPAKYAADNAALLADLASKDPSLQLNVANAVWAQTGTPFGAAYVADAGKYFSAGAKSVDFRNGLDAASAINQWVSSNTGGEITELVSADSVQNAASVLTDAVYFKGSWADSFDPANTTPAAFNLTDGSVIQVPTMNRSGSILAYFDQTFTVVSLPYAGKPSLSMIIAMPTDGQSLSSVLQSTNASAINEVVSQFEPHRIDLFLPKFHIEYSQELKAILQGMGIKLAFTKSADFEPMGIPNIYVSSVIHKAVLDVDEKGTTAAAATGVVMRSLAMSAQRTVKFDRPFICAIRDNSTGALLFIGTVNRPS